MRSKRQNPLPPKLAGWCCLERRRLEKIVQKPFGAKADEEAKRYAVRAGQRRRIQPITDGIGSDNGMLSEVMPPCPRAHQLSAILDVEADRTVIGMVHPGIGCKERATRVLAE